MPRNPPPPRIYKYQPFSVETLTNLVSGKLWCSAPRRFNDPFDCALPLFDPSRLTEADHLKAFNYYKGQQPTGQFVVERMCPDGVPSEAFRNLIVRSATEGFAERRKILQEQRGVACFSAKPLDITMWSHYADGHRGFCLEFDTSIHPFTEAYYVRYADEFPYVNPVDVIVDPFNDDPENDLFVASVLTKSSGWRYEDEWRIMHTEPDKPYGYERRALTGIYFGSQISSAHRDILCLMLRGMPTQLYSVDLDRKGFALRAKKATYTPNDYK